MHNYVRTIILTPFLIILAIVTNTLAGYIVGGVVSMFFDETIHGVMGSIVPVLRNTPLTEIGATLGFIGGFFK
jgi:hypothetical protein